MTPFLQPPARSEPATDDYVHVEGQFCGLNSIADEACRRRHRAQIIATCLPLADHIAYRFVGRGEPSEDLVQVARLGLVKTVDRYDPDKGRFLAFAVSTIIGEVRRHFRDNTWGMRVPREVKDTHLRVRDAIDAMSQRLGRAPTTGELAAELGLDREAIAQSVEATYAYRPLSLDVPPVGYDSSGTTLGALQGAEDPHYDLIENVAAVAVLVTELSDRERSILRMRFCGSLTQSEIAKALGISQVHVSRLLTGTLCHLRRRMQDDTAPGSEEASSHRVESSQARKIIRRLTYKPTRSGKSSPSGRTSRVTPTTAISAKE